MKYRSIFLYAIIFAVLISSVAEALTCDNCGKVISGGYYSSPDGKSYCADCYANNDICAKCGRMVKSTVNVDGYKLCPNCYRDMPVCSLCGKVVAGKYMSYAEYSLIVCADCERTKPRCQRCNIPSNKLDNIGGVMLCERCAGGAEVCRSCGKALLKDFVYFEGNEEFKYCGECVKSYPRCADCGAPSGRFGTRLEDGRYLCPDCRKFALFDAGLVKPIKERVLQYLSSYMNMNIKHKVDYSLEGQNFLKAKSEKPVDDLNGLFYRLDDQFNIYVLYGLREKDLIQVIAHEITHAWQAENCDDDLSDEDREGFAQWAAYKTLIHFGHEMMAKIMTEGETHYTSGLNRMLKIERAKGQQGVFEYIKE